MKRFCYCLAFACLVWAPLLAVYINPVIGIVWVWLLSVVGADRLIGAGLKAVGEAK